MSNFNINIFDNNISFENYINIKHNVNNLLDNLIKNNHIDFAEKYVLSLLEKEPKNAKYLFYLANIYYIQKKYDMSERYFLLAIKENYYQAYSNIANLYKDMNDYINAEKYYILASTHNLPFSSENLQKFYDSK